MENFLLIVLIAYVVVGALVYFVTETTALASRIEAATPLPWSAVESTVFALVVALWPLWLIYRPKDG